ncbi:hypothetical protein LTR85_000542 [Meristemomyces frigidus]|nr:hypothetical protein LTR85_000542 [Meristemomyces frigidus]
MAGQLADARAQLDNIAQQLQFETAMREPIDQQHREHVSRLETVIATCVSLLKAQSAFPDFLARMIHQDAPVQPAPSPSSKVIPGLVGQPQYDPYPDNGFSMLDLSRTSGIDFDASEMQHRDQMFENCQADEGSGNV